MKNKFYIIGIIILVLIGAFFIINKSSKDNNINIKCNNNIITLSKNDKKILNNYLNNENFSKDESGENCSVSGAYVIEYNNISLEFDDNCGVYLNNNKTYENYNTSLSNDLINYVKNICN